MNAKHIVQVSAYYPPHLGGQEYAVQSLAQALARGGHEVDVIASASGAQKGTQIEHNIRVTRLAGPTVGHAPIMPRLPQALWAITRPKSVVHIHVGQAFTPEIVWFMSRIKPFPYIAQLHIDFEPSGPLAFLLPAYKKFLLKRVIQSAAAVVVLNQNALAVVRKNYHFKGPAHIINNGIDEAYFELKRTAFPAEPPPILRLLFVGRLSKQKNVPALLEALAHTKRNVFLDMVGDGEERTTIEQTIKKLNLKNVRLYGRLPRDDILAFYASHDALIMPSLYEAQPLVLLEAMAARIPIIGTDVVGIAEHMQGIGITVPPTPGGLADGIKQYDKKFTSLPRFVARGFTRAQTHRWHNLLDKYEALYEKISTH